MDHDTYFYRYGEAHPDDLARWCAEPEPQQPEPEQPEPEPTIEDLREAIRREFDRANANFYRALKAEAEVAGLRRALEWLAEEGLRFRGRMDGKTGLVPFFAGIDYRERDPECFVQLAAAAGVPLADLTDEEVPA